LEELKLGGEKGELGTEKEGPEVKRNKKKKKDQKRG